MNTIRISLRALAKNRMRAGLTVLGVVIGIAAVTMIVSIGQSASRLVQEQFQTLGTNVIVVMPGSRRRGGIRQGLTPTLTAQDGDAIVAECSSVLAASPIVGVTGQTVFRNNNWQPHDMYGVGPSYVTVRNWPLEYGVFFSDREVKAASKVCVLGHTLVVKLFQTTNPIGQTIRIKNIPFRVIGVLGIKGANIVGEDQDDIVLMPYTTARKRLQRSDFQNVNAIVVSANTMERMADAQMEIEQLLYERHRILPGAQADFEVQDTAEIASILGIITGTLTTMLSAIAGISLIVGGVGIMNIMLVSVTERTREIGIRMAVGARPRDILRQFLVESVILSGLGGFVGSSIGIGASLSLTLLINSSTLGVSWPMVVSIPAVVIAAVFAGSVGVFFGYYPARRASLLDPVDALRYE